MQIIEFETHKHIYDLFIKTGLIIDFHIHIQERLLDIYNEQTGEDYDYDWKCYECVGEFLHKIYTWYEKRITPQDTEPNQAHEQSNDSNTPGEPAKVYKHKKVKPH